MRRRGRHLRRARVGRDDGCEALREAGRELPRAAADVPREVVARDERRERVLKRGRVRRPELGVRLRPLGEVVREAQSRSSQVSLTRSWPKPRYGSSATSRSPRARRGAGRGEDVVRPEREAVVAGGAREARRTRRRGARRGRRRAPTARRAAAGASPPPGRPSRRRTRSRRARRRPRRSRAARAQRRRRRRGRRRSPPRGPRTSRPSRSSAA